jgi:hypothetical protein
MTSAGSRQSGGRGVPALRFAGAVLKTAFRPEGSRARRRAAEEGPQDYGDDRSRPRPMCNWSGLICRGGRTVILPSAPAFISAWDPSSCASRGNAHLRPVQVLPRLQLAVRSRTSGGGSGPVSEPSKACQSLQNSAIHPQIAIAG